MSSVTSTANLSDFTTRKTNVGVDTSVFRAYEVISDTIVANHIDAPSGGLDLNGIIGINTESTTATETTTIGGTPLAATPFTQTVYIGCNDSVTWGDNTGTKGINIGTTNGNNRITVGGTGGNTIAIGIAQTAGSVTIGNQNNSDMSTAIKAGNGGMTIASAGSNTLSSAADLHLESTTSTTVFSSGTISINTLSGQTINIANSDNVNTFINIGTGGGTAVETIRIGNSVSGSRVTIQLATPSGLTGGLVLTPIAGIPVAADNAAAAALSVPVGGLYRSVGDPSILYIRTL